MHTFTSEDLEMLRQAAAARAEVIARRMREIDDQRRALWLRMDVQREQGAAHAPAGASVFTATGDTPAAPPAPEPPTHGANPSPTPSRVRVELGSPVSVQDAGTLALVS